MELFLENEFLDFAKHHKNKVNLIIHIGAGTIYMASLNVLSNYTLLPIYSLLLLITLKDIIPIILSILYIYITTIILYKYKVKVRELIYLFIFSCFIVPYISHVFTRETIVLNYENLSFIKFITNIVYFLPFSIRCFI